MKAMWMQKALGLASLALAEMALADGTPLATTSADVAYALDTVFPVAIKTAADSPISLWEKTGDEVTAIAPDGTATTVSSDSWAPAAGGLWTLTRTKQGIGQDTAFVTARHGLFGTQGAGTAASPAKLVDADELADFDSAGLVSNGYTFELDGADGLLGSLRTPAGYRIEEVGGGLWKLVTVVGDCLYEWGEIAYFLDSREGATRTATTREILPIAYTGDNWSLRAPLASTLTLVSPSGVTSVRNLGGTGVVPMRLRESGLWQLSLAFGGTTLVSEVKVSADATTILMR